MNKARRREIDSATGKLTEAIELLEAIRDDEQEYFDNMPESLQGSTRGEAAEDAISNLEDAIGFAEDAIRSAEEAMG